jgi:hypothetical protein
VRAKSPAESSGRRLFQSDIALKIISFYCNWKFIEETRTKMSKPNDAPATSTKASTSGRESHPPPRIPAKQPMEQTTSSADFFEGSRDGFDDYDDFDIDGKFRGDTKGQGKQGGQPSIYSAKHTRMREARPKTTPTKKR